MLKDVEPAELVDAVRVVAGGEALLMPRHTRRLIEAFVAQAEAGPPRDDAVLEELTPREREVLTLVGQGLSNHEIAEALVLSPLTAKTHVARLFTKLGARDRAQLVVIGVRDRAWSSQGAARADPNIRRSRASAGARAGTAGASTAVARSSLNG